MILNILLAPFRYFYKILERIGSYIYDFFFAISRLLVPKRKKEPTRKILMIDFEAEAGKRSTKKLRYKYIVKDENGKTIKGYFDGYSRADVHAFLLSQGYDVYSIEEDKLSNVFSLATMPYGGKLRTNQLEFFLTQLSTYIKAGITLVESIKILSKQVTSASEKRLYQKLVFELNTGESFSEAMEKQGNAFPKLLINMVRTSELTGQLTEVLDDMAQYYHGIALTRKQVIGAMTYPSVIFVIAITIVAFIMLWVVPEFVDIYAQTGANLPAITVFIINLSTFLKSYFIIIILVVLVTAFTIIVLYQNVKSCRYAMQWFLMHVPIVKTILINQEVIMFTKTFASLLNYDVFITNSMELLSKITNNEIYIMLIKDAISSMKNGNGVSTAFKNHWAFPSTAYEMLLTGEKTGRMADMMKTVSRYYEEQQTNTVNQLKSLIEPIMIVFLALIVGVILLAVVIPMFDIYNQV